MPSLDAAIRAGFKSPAHAQAFLRRRPAPTFVGGGGGVESQASAAIPSRYPSVATGDIELVWIETNFDSPGTISTAGWAECPGSPVQGSDTCLAVWWHRYTSGDGLPTVDDSGDHQVAYTTAFRGCRRTADPFDSYAAGTSAAATTATWPEFETHEWNTLVLFILSSGRDANVTDGLSSGLVYGDSVGAGRYQDRTSAIGAGGGAVILGGVKGEPGPSGVHVSNLGLSTAHAMLVLALR